jgi:hypothetical protein
MDRKNRLAMIFPLLMDRPPSPGRLPAAGKRTLREAGRSIQEKTPAGIDTKTSRPPPLKKRVLRNASDPSDQGGPV